MPTIREGGGGGGGGGGLFTKRNMMSLTPILIIEILIAGV